MAVSLVMPQPHPGVPAHVGPQVLPWLHTGGGRMATRSPLGCDRTGGGEKSSEEAIRRLSSTDQVSTRLPAGCSISVSATGSTTRMRSSSLVLLKFKYTTNAATTGGMHASSPFPPCCPALTDHALPDMVWLMRDCQASETLPGTSALFGLLWAHWDHV
ncbi:hypothetical protein O3P69_006546 [Scylla paramamosain]|uniref:Uncharacterized protein n=1 Tax=Scylla paramamosain TaxID=85552 RepID=A0AAW0U558_SCYPA